MEQKRDFLKIFVFVLIIVGIIVVVLIFVFKDKLFGGGKHLAAKTQPELAAKGFGTYSKIAESPCITSDGKCNIAGIKYVTEFCTPHSDTGKGCIDENGEQTFNSRQTTKLCQQNCRSYILNEISQPYDQGCAYDAPYNSPQYNCVTSNAKSFFYRNFSCVKNDSIGDNTCTYTCGSGGVDSAGINGDADVSKLSYIPTCVTKPGTTIILNSLPWQNINKLKQGGQKMSKGYTISNIIDPKTNKVDSTQFKITPAYPPWAGNEASNIISYDALYELDTQFTLYDNCILDKKYVKPFCDDYYYFRPTALDSDETYNPNPKFCSMDASFPSLNDCSYHPWQDPAGVNTKGNTGLSFINPYVGITGSTGATSQLYSWQGVGNFGYIYSGLSCLDNNAPLTGGVVGTTGTSYNIPFGAVGSTGTGYTTCLNLNANPIQCADSLEVMFQATPQQNIGSLIKQYELQQLGQTGFSGPQVLTSYPQTANTTNYICTSTRPDGSKDVDSAGNTVPGCIQTCRYMPNQNEIDMNYIQPGTTNVKIHPEFKQILGNFITLNLNNGSTGYFLGVQNTPCNVGSTGAQGVPLGNCRGVGSTGYVPTRCSFIYNGGGGLTGGNYWSKNNCDSNAIELSSEMKLIFSIGHAYGAGSILGSTGIQKEVFCDIYVLFGGYYGYLSADSVNGIVNPTDISNLFTSNPQYNNIIANLSTTSTPSLVYNALPFGSLIPSGTNNNVPMFVLKYDDINDDFTLKSNDLDDIYCDTYDGNTYSEDTTLLKFGALPTNAITYSTTSFTSNSLINSVPGSIFEGQDIYRSITLQRRNQCYTQSLCLSGNTGAACYPNSCNLYYEYTPEFCAV